MNLGNQATEIGRSICRLSAACKRESSDQGMEYSTRSLLNLQRESALARTHSAARAEGKINSDERSRNNNKKVSIDSVFSGAKTTDKNLTAEWRPDCSNSLSSLLFYSRAWRESESESKREREVLILPPTPTPLFHSQCLLNCLPSPFNVSL